jgi:hypothetical protein
MAPLEALVAVGTIAGSDAFRDTTVIRQNVSSSQMFYYNTENDIGANNTPDWKTKRKPLYLKIQLIS